MKPLLHCAGALTHFQWNLECSVGRNAENRLACDVAYIQWYYMLAAAHPNTPPERRAAYSKVSVTGGCRGTDDDPLIRAIVTHQTALKHQKIDGKLSVAKGNGKIGVDAYFVLRLGARLSDMYPQFWPRLDLIPTCPPLVANAVRSCIPRVSA